MIQGWREAGPYPEWSYRPRKEFELILWIMRIRLRVLNTGVTQSDLPLKQITNTRVSNGVRGYWN